MGETNVSLGNKKVGLALGGGAARGIAHVGVIKVLEKKGIIPQMIAGTSIGAIIGAIYAKEMDIVLLEQYAMDWSRWRTAQLLDPTLPRVALIKGKKVEAILDTYLGQVTFSELKVPFACVAVDIDSGEEIVFKEGLVASAVRASISVPGVFPPIERDGAFIVDGGLVNPVPVSTVREMGAEYVIAVNVLPHPRGRLAQQDTGELSKGLNIFAILMQTVNVSANIIAQLSLEGADLVIEPDVSSASGTDFHLASELIPRGEEAAERALATLAL